MSLFDSIESLGKKAESLGSDAAIALMSGAIGASKLSADGLSLFLGQNSGAAAKAAASTDSSAGSKTDEDAFSALQAGAKFAFEQAAGSVGSLTQALPGLAITGEMVNLGFGTFENLTSGDRLRNNSTSSIESLIPGSENTIASDHNDAKKATAPHQNDAIFNYVSAYQWQNIIKSDAAHVAGGGGADSLPKDVQVDGNKHIHTQADGTVTTQDGSKTQIAHANGDSILKDATSGLTGLVIDSKLVFSEDTKNHSEQWMTPQGAKVVKTSDNQYEIFDSNGNLIAKRSAQIVQNEVSQTETATLSNGERLIRHLGGQMVAGMRSHIHKSGAEWGVYSDGITRTLANGMLVGMSKNQDAMVKTGNYTVVREGSDHKYYVIDGDGTRKAIDPSNLSGDTADAVKKALKILQTLDHGSKLETGDGTYIIFQNGAVQGGSDTAGSDSGNSDGAKSAGNNTPGAATDNGKGTSNNALVTTDGQTTTAKLQGGLTDTYNFTTHKEQLVDPKTNQTAVTIQDDQVTTAYVTTTARGTTDNSTGDLIGHDGTVKTTDGIDVAANNDIKFADGTQFDHSGKIVLADGRQFNEDGSFAGSQAGSQQAAAALAAASGVADAIAAGGSASPSQIAALQALLANLSGMEGQFAASGNTPALDSIHSAESVVSSALGVAMGNEATKPAQPARLASNTFNRADENFDQRLVA